MIKVFVLCILFILFIGCSEEKRQEYLEPKDCLPDEKVIEEKFKLEDTITMYSNAFNKMQIQQEKDFQAMEKALNGFSDCSVAVNCSHHEDYEYEGFACSDLTEKDLEYYINSCSFSNSYNEFYEYVEKRSYEYD